jgi:hypothetical protein
VGIRVTLNNILMAMLANAELDQGSCRTRQRIPEQSLDDAQYRSHGFREHGVNYSWHNASDYRIGDRDCGRDEEKPDSRGQICEVPLHNILSW